MELKDMTQRYEIIERCIERARKRQDDIKSKISAYLNTTAITVMQSAVYVEEPLPGAEPYRFTRENGTKGDMYDTEVDGIRVVCFKDVKP